ncbi:condensation domain-containing protein, partial [Tolypothrix sp. VBCCA 56010]|uniref:condensation domain-containing protein n=1 Tax=Tolypothrix sp. VBCCA 56010 TaxID=3137731 RepID=UPI003D7E87E4
MKIIIEEFLSYLCSLDIKLWADGDRLRCSAPEGTLTPSLRVQLQERKAEILAFLQKANLGSSSTLDPILLVPREGKLPLSFAQQRLWFLQQLEVDSGFYNIYVTVRFEGQLNVAALESSLNYIINRHEALRTNFVTVNGQPVQVIHPNRGLPLQVVDLQQLDQTQREITCQQLAISEASRPFDLAVDPLVRASLLKLGEKEHVLLVVMHHIVSDGWSIGVLVRELAAVYQATCNSTA